MTAREVITLNESTPQLEAPQSGDTYSMPRDLQMYQATNDANPQIRIGSADANEGHIQAVYDSGAQTLDYLEIKTDSGGEGDIVLSPSSGNVGIGTTSPGEELQVVGTTDPVIEVKATGADSTPSLSIRNDAQRWSLFTGSSDNFAVRDSTAGNNVVNVEAGAPADSLVIDSAGLVGIGTSNPLSLLHLGTATEAIEFVDAGSTSATEQDWIEVQVGGNTGYIRVFSTK